MNRCVAAIVVTYNRKELLRQNIESLLIQRQKEALDILIVDNASTDGTKEAIAEYIDRGDILMKWAMQGGYGFFWLMDDDTIPETDALEALLKAYEHVKDGCGFLCSRVLWKDETPCVMNIPKYKCKKIDQTNLMTELTEVTQASFVSLFTSRRVVEKVGLPIKEFFIWGDDVEYTRRIGTRYHLKSYLVKSSIVHHLMGTNKGSNISCDILARIGRYRFAYRNEFYTYRQEGGMGMLYFGAKCLFNLIRIIFCGSDNKSERVSILVNGIIEGVHFKPRVEYAEPFGAIEDTARRKTGQNVNWGGLIRDYRFEVMLCGGCRA